MGSGYNAGRMAVDILSTKLFIPPRRKDAISRPRLVEKLLEGVSRPGTLVILSGPAGFGKTTLLSEFVSLLQKPVAWVSLDEGDNDPIRFWSYLIAALQSRREGIGEAALALARTSQPIPEEAIPTMLINDLAGQDQELVLALDDYHTIQNPAIHPAMGFLVEHLPVELKVIVSTRVDPPWPLARFRARNQLVEVRANDLRFEGEEANEFLTAVMSLDLTREEVNALEERTEGWAAGLQLATLSLKGRSDVAGFIKAFAGSQAYVAEYLVEEVLQRQAEETQKFLLRTSLLEKMNAGLCEAVTRGADGQDMLTALQRANLFVIPLDDENRWFRYHHLFADLLQARLRQSLPREEIAGLHREAATWFEKEGMAEEAIEHALAAEDYVHALQLVEKNALPMILQAYVNTAEGWLLAIPQELIERSAKANMALAWMNLIRGSVARAAPYMERLGTLLSSPEDGKADQALQGEWLALQSKFLVAQGKPEESQELALRALQILPEREVFVRSMVYTNLALAYQQMLDYDRAAGAFQMMVQNAREMGDYVTETLGSSGQAQMLLQQGKLHAAFQVAEQAIERLEASGKRIPFSSTLYGELGQIYYHWNDLARAEGYFKRSIRTSGQSGYSDPEIYYHVMLSRMSQIKGNWEEAAREAEKASEMMRSVPPIMVREEAISQQVRVDLALGRLPKAKAALEAEGFGFEAAFSFPQLVAGATITQTTGLLYNSALRILLQQAKTEGEATNLKQGIALAGEVLRGELQSKNIPIALETLLLRGQLFEAQGEKGKSREDVCRALELAEPEGIISKFLEEGKEMRLLIADCRLMIDDGRFEIGGGSEKKLLKFVDRVMEAFGVAPAIGVAQKARGQEPHIEEPIEPLTGREMEVLRLMAAGDSNRRIAEKLVITVSAVKKHTGNIFGKLNVNSRTQAAALARQLGLLETDGEFLKSA